MFGEGAHACAAFIPRKLDHIQYADVVVIGHVFNYTIVRDEASRRRILSNPKLSEADRKFYEDKNTGLVTDHARFEIRVEKTLKGRVPRKVSVTWDNSTFEEPGTMASGPFLIALRRSGANATAQRDPRTDSFVLLQAPCSSPFLFESATDEAKAVRRMIQNHPSD